jgi:hypothetical protein
VGHLGLEYEVIEAICIWQLIIIIIIMPSCVTYDTISFQKIVFVACGSDNFEMVAQQFYGPAPATFCIGQE